MSRNNLGNLIGGKSASNVQTAVSGSQGGTYFPSVSENKSTNEMKSQNSTASMPIKEN